LDLAKYITKPQKTFMKRKKIDIGETIRKVAQAQGWTTIDLAKAIGCERTNLYDIYKRESVDINLLMRISEVMNHDFLQYYATDTPVSSKYATVLIVGEEQLQELKQNPGYKTSFEV
jgi:transcriptional regulator with XRE-family HTH domain